MDSFFPNYFIAGDNLMDGKTENDEQILLLRVTGDILHEPVKAITQIDCDHVGKLFSPSSKDDYQVLITEAHNSMVDWRYMGRMRIEVLLISKLDMVAFITPSLQYFVFSSNC